MMPSVEYRTLYRFVASLGLLAIVGSVMVPWLFINNLDVLLVTTQDLASLTPVARSVIELRQDALSVAQVFIVTFSLVMFAFGVAGLWWSLLRWSERQAKEDRREDLELARAEGAFEDAGPSASEKKAADESEELGEQLAEAHRKSGGTTETTPDEAATGGDDPEVSATGRPARSSARFARELYERTETRLLHLLDSAYGDIFEVRSDVRAKSDPNGPILDFLLDPYYEGPWGPIGIELKVVANVRGVRWVVERGASSLAIATKDFATRGVYTAARGRPAAAISAAVLVIVLDLEGYALDRAVAETEDALRSFNSGRERTISGLAISMAMARSMEPEILRSGIASSLRSGFSSLIS